MMNLWKTTARKNKVSIKVFGIPTLAKFILERHEEFKTFLTQEFLRNGILGTNVFIRVTLIIKSH